MASSDWYTSQNSLGNISFGADTTKRGIWNIGNTAVGVYHDNGADALFNSDGSLELTKDGIKISGNSSAYNDSNHVLTPASMVNGYRCYYKDKLSAEISNDTTNHKKLRLIGNSSDNSSGVRKVGVWDNLDVYGNLSTSASSTIGGNSTISGSSIINGDSTINGNANFKGGVGNRGGTHFPYAGDQHNYISGDMTHVRGNMNIENGALKVSSSLNAQTMQQSGRSDGWNWIGAMGPTEGIEFGFDNTKKGIYNTGARDFNIYHNAAPGFTVTNTGTVRLPKAGIVFNKNFNFGSDANNSEIANDTGAYKSLMILGNTSQGDGKRHVSLWDDVYVNGNLAIKGTLTVNGRVI